MQFLVYKVTVPTQNVTGGELSGRGGWLGRCQHVLRRVHDRMCAASGEDGVMLLKIEQ
jgi:hypothetical protein